MVSGWGIFILSWRHGQDLKNSTFRAARLLLEPLPCDSPRKGEHIHSRLVAVSRYVFPCVAYWFSCPLSENSNRMLIRPMIELEMRRPNKERYRLDRLLERKAKEGVKIYVIL